MEFWITYGKAAKTAVGFFWKAGWAFVLGYAISAMIQAFVSKARLTRHLGSSDPKSIALSTGFGSISSSCSFAALATARSLVMKGASFVAAVAFMFASTNLVIELGILILIFLGWQFLVAEVIGGILLIVISAVLIRLTYPRQWYETAQKELQQQDEASDEEFDWRQRMTSLDGWSRVGQHFVMEWKMVWQEILIGFTVAGFVATFVPASFWQTIFLADQAQQNPGNFLIALENAVVAPFVAAATFIGSMGNIPLATVLNAGGVLFAGIMSFIYSDLMVPPLVKVNAKYYGWKLALYVAAVMFVSIVCTALILHYGFYFTGLTPNSSRRVEEATQFAIDYTFYLNVAAVLVVGGMIWLWRIRRRQMDSTAEQHDSTAWSVQDYLTTLAIVLLIGGLAARLFWGYAA